MVFAMFHLCRRSPESVRIGPFWPRGLMPTTPMVMSRLVALSLTFSCLVIVRSNLPIRPHLISWVRYCIQTKLCAFCEFRLSAWGRRPGLPWSPSGPVAWILVFSNPRIARSSIWNSFYALDSRQNERSIYFHVCLPLNSNFDFCRVVIILHVVHNFASLEPRHLYAWLK